MARDEVIAPVPYQYSRDGRKDTFQIEGHFDVCSHLPRGTTESYRLSSATASSAADATLECK